MTPTHLLAFLLGANLAFLVAIFILLTLTLRGVRDLIAMHHDLIARLLVLRGAKPVAPVGPIAQHETEGAAA